jgi:pimeloyl-ACP methyl ester carboxylesterase
MAAAVANLERARLVGDREMAINRIFDAPRDRVFAAWIVGDADVMRPEHAVDLFRLLPHARLAVLPGTDHMALMTRTAWVAPMVSEFLDAAMPNNGR